MVPSGSVNAGARLDRLPISRFHWKILALIAGGAFIDSYDIYLGGGVMAAMVAEGFSTLPKNAIFVSATFFGMLIGAGFAGYVGDKMGRRYSYQVNLAIFGLASLLACFAPNIETLIVLRFMMGLGLGAELVVAAGTLCEFIPPSHRGRWICLLGTIIVAGLPVASTIGYFVIPTFGWRWMFAIAAIMSFVIWIMRKRMPESPRWLETVGRLEEAEQTLREIERGVERRHGPLPAVKVTTTVVPSADASKTSIWALFRKPYLARTIVACLVLVCINVSVHGFVAWLPTFLVKEGVDIVKSLGYVTLMSLGAPAGGLAGYFLADRLPRRTALLLSCALIIGSGLVYPAIKDPVLFTAVGFVLMTSIYMLVALGQFGFVPELFPTKLRLRGTGISQVAGRAASITNPYIVVLVFDRFGLNGILIYVAGLLALLGLAIIALGIETGSSSLEEASELDEAEPALAKSKA